MAAAVAAERITVPRLWPGSTIVILGSGPSLTPDDVASCQGRARVIAIKETIRLAPWADVLYAAGGDRTDFWRTHTADYAGFEGLRYALHEKSAPWATVLRNTGYLGIETDPSGLRTGKNSGFSCINLAVHLGAAKIVLLGYDLAIAGQKYHWFGNRSWEQENHFPHFRELYASMVEPLEALGVQVINASRETELLAFPRCSLAEALAP